MTTKLFTHENQLYRIKIQDGLVFVSEQYETFLNYPLTATVDEQTETQVIFAAGRNFIRRKVWLAASNLIAISEDLLTYGN